MRIDDLNRTPPAPAAEKSDPASAQTRSDKSNLSSNGTDEADVSNLAQTLATKNPQRLEQLRLEVQSGNYNVSAEAVANAIIDAHTRE